MGDALHTDGAVVSAQEARLADAGLITAQGPTLLDVRTGVLIGPGAAALVTGTASTAPMQYAIAPHQWVTSRGAAQGPYRGSLDAVQLVDTTAAPGSGSRIDLIYEKQGDSTPGVPTPDATTAPIYGVVQGQATSGTPAKPALPVGAIEVASVRVDAGATRTDGAGITISQTARLTAARGAPIPVRSQADRDALTAYDGMSVKRLDAGGAEEHRIDGTWWRVSVGGLFSDAPASYGAAFEPYGATPLRAHRDQNGMVTLDGLIRNPVEVTNLVGTWFTLPTAYRPAVGAPRVGLAYIEGGAIAAYQVNDNGTVAGVRLVVGSYPVPAGRYWSFNHHYRGA